ncbi:MAG: hypothetical protein LH468_12995, partial [Nocardioides sp.]|nr:hypothetical protein [Nocardioides sp.]
MSAVEHLGVGSRAQHWKATAGLRPVLFVTHEPLPVAGAEALEDAYAAAADLAFALDVVVSSVPSSAGTWTLPVAGGALSVTPWVVGEALGSPGPPLADRADTEDTVRMLARLHAAHPPRRTPRWVSGVEPDLGAALRARAARPWDSGPLGAPARAAVAAPRGAVAPGPAAPPRRGPPAPARPGGGAPRGPPPGAR